MNEIRQKFEIAKQAELSYVVLLDGDCVDEFTDEIAAKEYVRWFSGKLRAAYEAGEIAMKEKAAKMVEAKFEIAYSGVALAGPCYGPFPVTQPVTITVGGTPITDAIRALPLSGAEESKK